MARRRSSFKLAWVGLLWGCAEPPVAQAPRTPCVLPPSAPPSSLVSDPGILAPTELAPPDRWLVLGTFPNPTLDAPTASGATRGGVDQDYLEAIGGEAAAVITADTASRIPSANETIVVREVRTQAFGSVELDRPFPQSSNRILYAYAELRSDRDQVAMVHFGVDDSAKVWVNGKLVHSRFHPGRPVTRWAEEFPITLARGDNRILIKVDNGWLGAGFMFEPFTAEAHAARIADRAEQQFGEASLVFADGKGFVRDDGTLPGVVWENPIVARWSLGSADLVHTWYDPRGKPVTVAKDPGVYTAIVSYHTKRGLPARRALPLLQVPNDFWTRFGFDQVSLSRPASVANSDWVAFENAAKGWTSDLVRQAPQRDPASALVLASLVSPSQRPPVDLGEHAPILAWQQSSLDLKRSILGLGPGSKVGPSRRRSAAPVLRVGSAQQAGIKAEAVDELRKIATDWANTERQPFVLAVARHGILFLHEGFGKLGGKPISLAHRFRPASIGKNFAALVFAQFVERDWLRPDQVVGELLSSWPRSGDKAVSFRQLYDHTAGLSGHTSFLGLDNPWLEETFAAHVLPSCDVGVRYEYEGDGGNIAAKAMELIDGRAFPIIQREALFRPLGANSIDQWDCGWAASATTLDMAKVAQMLLQKGAYGEWQFFGEATWKTLLPIPLASLYPKFHDSEVERGIGLEHAWDPEDEVAGTGRTPATEVSRKGAKKLHTVGHGSASTSIYRIDYQHDLVMVAGRISAPDGDAYDKYLRMFVRRLESSLIE